MSRTELPIGVFDSGVGGLTVLSALARRLPHEHLLYLGDTARVPYGSRSPETVQRYAAGVADTLLQRGIKALVVACNTATTWALDGLVVTGSALGIPVVGVIRPGVEVALTRTTSGHVGVIGTEGTVAGGRYEAELTALRPGVTVSTVACPLFVSLAEEGWTAGDVPRLVAETYLAPLVDGPDVLILGCTHYPLLRDVIQAVLPDTDIVDSAVATADHVARTLGDKGLLRSGRAPGTARYLVTDNLDRFRRVGTRFLSAPPAPVELVDLETPRPGRWRTDAGDAA